MEDKKKPEMIADMSDIKHISIKEDGFKINRYAFVKDNPFEDLVTTSAPYYHFQILRPENDEQRMRSLDYFNEHKKLFVAWVNFPHILLYLGATEDIYIRSRMCDNVDVDNLQKVIEDAGHWYRLYGVK